MSQSAITTEGMIRFAEIFRSNFPPKSKKTTASNYLTGVSQEDFIGLAWRWEQGLLQKLSVLL